MSPSDHSTNWIPLASPDHDSKPSTGTRQEWVYQQLKEAILSGQFVPGRSVTLRGISAMLDVSLTPVREALRRLVAERALEIQNNRRVSVPTMTPEKLKDICDARIQLETFAAGQALPYIDKKSLKHLWHLNELIDKAIELEDTTGYLHHHRDFHFTLYRAGRSDIIMPLIESIWMQFSPFMSLAIHHVGVDYLIDHHIQALHAIENNDVFGLRFAIESDIRQGLGSIDEKDWKNL